MKTQEKTRIELRKELLALRTAIDSETMIQFALEARDRLLKSPDFIEAKTVMLYMDYRKEVPTMPLIEGVLEQGKTLVLPYTDGEFQILPYAIPWHKDLRPAPTNKDPLFTKKWTQELFSYLSKSKMGIWEPNLHKRGLPKPSLINPAEIDLVILPGVAFDLEGNRLGYGKGCYDRFLPKLKPQAKKIALAYEFQIVKAIPIQPFDVKIDGFL